MHSFVIKRPFSDLEHSFPLLIPFKISLEKFYGNKTINLEFLFWNVEFVVKYLSAIFTGAIFIIMVMICLQLAFVFVAVGYNALAIRYEVLNSVTGYFRYLIGIPLLLLVSFFGGYIAAAMAKKRTNYVVWIVCSSAALISQGGMLFTTLEFSKITLTGIVVILLSIIGAITGGQHWLQKSPE